MFNIRYDSLNHARRQPFNYLAVTEGGRFLGFIGDALDDEAALFNYRNYPVVIPTAVDAPSAARVATRHDAFGTTPDHYGRTLAEIRALVDAERAAECAA